jgi:hypothetical protein
MLPLNKEVEIEGKHVDDSAAATDAEVAETEVVDAVDTVDAEAVDISKNNAIEK